MMVRALRLAILLFGVAVITVGLALPEHAIIPVEGATSADWNAKTFWYEPWGKSGVHKGIDIFAPEGRAVIAAVPGIVVYEGALGSGRQCCRDTWT